MPQELDNDGFLPQTNTVSPEQQGAAVTKSLTDEQAKAKLKARLDELDINDPGEAKTPEVPAPEVATTEVKKTETPAEPAYAPDLLARAREHGITPAEAKEYGSPAVLEKALAHLDRSLSRRRPEPVQQQAPPPVVEEEPGFPELPSPSDEGVEWDPNLRQWVAQTQEAWNKARAENKQLKESLSKIGEHLQRQEVERVTQQWDGFFEKAPAEFKAAVGDGALADLEGTAAGDLRKDVFRTFLALQQNYQASGQKAPSFKTLAERALRACATPATTTATPDPKTVAVTTDQLARDAQGRFMAPPTSRNGSVNSSQLNTDKPPADPKLHDQWAMNRFRKNAQAVFGDE